MCCWSVASDSQTEEAKLYIERYIMSRIYMQAMFPNGDADVLRDQYVISAVLTFSEYIVKS